MSLEHDSSCFTCLYIIEKGKGKNQKKKIWMTFPIWNVTHLPSCWKLTALQSVIMQVDALQCVLTSREFSTYFTYYYLQYSVWQLLVRGFQLEDFFFQLAAFNLANIDNLDHTRTQSISHSATAEGKKNFRETYLFSPHWSKLQSPTMYWVYFFYHFQ